MKSALPRGVDALLQSLLPGDLAEPVAGDLLEEYLDVRQRRGPLLANLWAWSQAIRLAATFRWDRAVHGRGLPPIAEELRFVSGFWDGLRQDVLFSGRMVRRQPGFTAVALVALTLGIGATTAVFTIVDAVLWRPLPFANAEPIVSVAEQRPREGRVNGAVAPADFLDWRAMNRTFSAMASVTSFALNLTGDVEPQRLRALAVSPEFFDTIGVSPVQGRPFSRDAEELGRERVAMISDGLWRGAFGERPDIVGSTVLLNAERYEVVGILPDTFWWPSRPEVVVPRAFEPQERAERGWHQFDVVGRLRPGITLAQARGDMAEIGRQLAAKYPKENAGHFPRVAPLRDVLVGDVSQPLLLLLGAVGLVLLIACANVSTLLVARATARRKEMAIRLTLGAGRVRLIRQLLTESVVLAVVGGAGGVLLAAWLLSAAAHLMPARLLALPGLERIAIDVRVLAAAIGTTLATTVLFGVVPAYTASADNAAAALGEGGRSGTMGVGTRRVRAALVAAELALSLMLLVGAALLMVSFARLIDVPTGFQSRDIVTMRVTLPFATYGESARVTQFYEAVLGRLRGAASVEAAGAVTLLPFSGADSRSAFTIEGRAPATTPVRARPVAVSPGYLEAMRIPLLRGRYLTPRDAAAAPEVVVINEAAARRYWPGANPIGARLSFAEPSPRWLEVVGVVGAVKSQRLDVDPEPEAYLSYLQQAVVGSTRAMSVVVRTALPLAAAAPLLRTAVGELDRDQPVGPIRPMDDLVDESVAPARLNLWLLGAFAAIALALTAEGLYGVMAYLVAQRSHEIGIRMALGASRPAVLLMMLREAGMMTGAGIAAGLAGALLLSRFLATVLFGVSATDPLVYAAVALLLGLVALAAVAVPSSRATRVDPLVALRDN